MTRVAVAIVIGCLVIAGAVYLGLRPRAVPAAAPPPAPVPPDRDVVRALEMQAVGQLEAERAQLDAACWTGPRTPSSYDVEIAIDARGHEVGRSVSERRDQPSRADVAACVRALRVRPISIAPPGTPVTLTIPLVLP